MSFDEVAGMAIGGEFNAENLLKLLSYEPPRYKNPVKHKYSRSASSGEWNTRPAEDALKAEIERLKAALNEIRTIGDCTAMIEDVVARGMMRKIAFDTLYGNKSLGQDTDVPANATDTNVGRMEEK